MSVFTKAQEAEIPSRQIKWLNKMTEPTDEVAVRNTIKHVWNKLLGLREPEIIICDSPTACWVACPDKNNFTPYFSFWLSAYAGLYEYAHECGVPTNRENLEIFLMWSENCPFVLYNDSTVYVSRKLTKVGYSFADETGNLPTTLLQEKFSTA